MLKKVHPSQVGPPWGPRAFPKRQALSGLRAAPAATSNPGAAARPAVQRSLGDENTGRSGDFMEIHGSSWDFIGFIYRFYL